MSEHQFESMRAAMVSNQLRTTAVSDPRVVAAMQSVAREDFVPEDRKRLAYVDVIVPLGKGRGLNPPMVTGRLLTEAGVNEADAVLLIGAATGYGAAVLASLAATVVAVEEDEALAATAEKALKPLSNVSLVKGALASGAARKGPYDVIVVDGLVESLPEALAKQLKDGGRIVAAVLDGGVPRIMRGVKSGGGFSLQSVVDADAAPLPGFAQPKGFQF